MPATHTGWVGMWESTDRKWGNLLLWSATLILLVSRRCDVHHPGTQPPVCGLRPNTMGLCVLIMRCPQELQCLRSNRLIFDAEHSEYSDAHLVRLLWNGPESGVVLRAACAATGLLCFIAASHKWTVSHRLFLRDKCTRVKEKASGRKFALPYVWFSLSLPVNSTQLEKVGRLHFQEFSSGG